MYIYVYRCICVYSFMFEIYMNPKASGLIIIFVANVKLKILLDACLFIAA